MRPSTRKRDIIESTDGSKAPVRGLLVTLVNLFDTDNTRTLDIKSFEAGAAALGYSCSESSWSALCKRLGASSTVSSEGNPCLDIGLLADHFSNRYDAVLEEVLKRLLSGMIALASRASSLEAAVDGLVNRDERERERKLKMVILRWKHGLLLCAFQAWATRAREQRQLLKQVIGNWKHKTVALVWRQWVDVVEETKRQRHIVAQVAGRMRNRLVASAFGTWKCMIEEVWLQKALAARHLSRWLHGQVSQAFFAWYETAIHAKEQRAMLLRVCARMVNQRLSQAFNRWQEVAQEAQWQRHLLEKVAGRMRNRLVAMAFAQWVDVVETLAEMLRAACARMANQAVARAFDTWAEHLHMVARVRTLAGRMLHALTGRCFDGWIAFVKTQQRILRRAVHAMGPGRLLWMAFQSWAAAWWEAVRQRAQRQLETSIDQRVQEHLRSGRGGAMTEGTSVASVSAIEGKMREAEEKLAAQLQEEARRREEEKLARQREEEERALRKEARIRKVVQRWQNANMSVSFDSWVEFWESVTEAKAALSRVATSWINISISRAWRCWSDMAYERSRLVRLAQRVLGRMRNILLDTVFDAWADYVYRAAEQRKADAAAQQARNEAQERAEQRKAQEDRLRAELGSSNSASDSRWLALIHEQADRLDDLEDRIAPLRTSVDENISAISDVTESFNRQRSNVEEVVSRVDRMTRGLDDLSVGMEQMSSGIEKLDGDLDNTIDRRIDAQKPSLLQLLDRRYGPHAHVQGMLHVQEQFVQRLSALDDECSFLRSILSNMVTAPGSLATLEPLSVRPPPPRGLRNAPIESSVGLAGGNAARWLRKSRSMPPGPQSQR